MGRLFLMLVAMLAAGFAGLGSNVANAEGPKFTPARPAASSAAAGKECPGKYHFITYACDCYGNCCSSTRYVCHTVKGPGEGCIWTDTLPDNCTSHSEGTWQDP